MDRQTFNMLLGILLILVAYFFISNNSWCEKQVPDKEPRRSGRASLPYFESYADVKQDESAGESDGESMNSDEGAAGTDMDSNADSEEVISDIKKKFMTRDHARDGKYKFSNYVKGKRGNNQEKALEFIDESNNLMENGLDGMDNQMGSGYGSVTGNEEKIKGYAPYRASHASNKQNPNEIFNSSNYLPNEKSVNPDWFDVVPDAISVKNQHLINVSKATGINTVGSSLRNPTYDLRGSPPNPKFVISPWMQSTIEPDTNFKSLCA
jgi:hypothetical protein